MPLFEIFIANAVIAVVWFGWFALFPPRPGTIAEGVQELGCLVLVISTLIILGTIGYVVTQDVYLGGM